MARLRAVVTIHAPGLGGSPSDGHLETATVNASWTASSTASISPRKRIRVATQRPYSWRKTASTVNAPASVILVGWTSLRTGKPGECGDLLLGLQDEEQEAQEGRGDVREDLGE